MLKGGRQASKHFISEFSWPNPTSPHPPSSQEGTCLSLSSRWSFMWRVVYTKKLLIIHMPIAQRGEHELDKYQSQALDLMRHGWYGIALRCNFIGVDHTLQIKGERRKKTNQLTNRKPKTAEHYKLSQVYFSKKVQTYRKSFICIHLLNIHLVLLNRDAAGPNRTSCMVLTF